MNTADERTPKHPVTPREFLIQAFEARYRFPQAAAALEIDALLGILDIAGFEVAAKKKEAANIHQIAQSTAHEIVNGEPGSCLVAVGVGGEHSKKCMCAAVIILRALKGACDA